MKIDVSYEWPVLLLDANGLPPIIWRHLPNSWHERPVSRPWTAGPLGPTGSREWAVVLDRPKKSVTRPFSYLLLCRRYMVSPEPLFHNSDLHLCQVFSAHMWLFRKPKVPVNALSPGAWLCGNGFFLFCFFRLLFAYNRNILFAFSWGVFFSKHNSETGFGQLSEFPRPNFFSILNWVKLKEVIVEKLDFRDHLVRFLSPISMYRILKRPRQSIPLDNPRT